MAETNLDHRSGRREAVAAAVLFVLACTQVLWFTVLSDLDQIDDVLSVGLFFVLLVGAYLGLSVRAARDRVHAALGTPVRRFLGGPVILLGAALAYAQASGLAIPPRALVYGGYLLAPAMLLFLCQGRSRSAPLWGLAAVSLFWLPIEFDLLPSLPLPPPGGYDVSRVVGIVAAFYLFLVAWPLRGVGYTLGLERRDFRFAGTAWVIYALLALPVGFVTGFLTWQPDVDPVGLLATPLVIYLITAVPEEFLFRGVIQNLLTRLWGPRVGLGVSAVIFGLAHLPDIRYALLATLAGLAYGWVYARTGRITASALTHTGVNWIWGLLLSYS